MDRFDNWYKRRINRIYPSIFAWALVASIFFNIHYDMKDIWLYGGGWFVTCIMLYYVVLYFIRKYLFDKKHITFILVSLIIIVWYCFEDVKTFFMYGNTYFKWAHYFLFMVVGAYIGANKIVLKSRPILDCSLLCVSVIFYYVMMFACKMNSVIAQWQILSLIPLMGITIYLYKICSTNKCKKKLEKHKGFVCAISGLCLEAYIVQSPLFTDKMNSIFPFNLILTMIAILILAYVVRSLGRVLVQIFGKQDFDWKEIVKI